jgi:lysophospholipase L1-like esterase/poly(3-hydroxybutyrate) depolymerase
MNLLAPCSTALALCAGLTPLQDPARDFIAGQVQVEEETYPYVLLPPSQMVEGERYPLVVFLHGIGERGSDNELQKEHFPKRMAAAEYSDRFPCFVLAPQCPKDQRWANVRTLDNDRRVQEAQPTGAMRGAIASLAEVVRTQPIDMQRIALTGLSMGGSGAWDLATRHPGWFSAAAPVCGGGDPETASHLAGLPVMVWHGAEDTVVPTQRSREMVEALRKLKHPVEYTELPGVHHDAWNHAYAPDGCLENLIGARRDPASIQVETVRLLARALAPDERVAFLGDSITQAGNRPGGYVDRIRSVLKEERPDVQVIPAGISGHKVPDLLKRFEADVIQKGATLVFIYIGINDVWHSQSGKGTSPEDFESGLHQLIDTLEASGAQVVLATPSVIGEKPSGENKLDEMLDAYAAISRSVAAAKGVTLCDLRTAFGSHLQIFNPTNLAKSVLTSDGVHLNAAGNVFLATEAARALRRAVLARD